LAEYDGAIRRGDRYVGKRLDHLDSLGLTDRTIVVFTSDHGEEFLEHGRCFHLTTLYREVLHVPLIVSAPGLEPGRVSRQGLPARSRIGLDRRDRLVDGRLGKT
jgi:arylsulfatase A-like enzyme